MFSKRSLEGYLMFDHRATGGSLVEVGAMTCCGCQRGIIANPARERARNYCRAHDHYMCDDCSLSFKLTGSHKSFHQVADEHQTKWLKEKVNG